eukprot:SAG31_NODE_1479_length_8180_cov_7.141684_4_plen_336_part_00
MSEWLSTHRLRWFGQWLKGQVDENTMKKWTVSDFIDWMDENKLHKVKKEEAASLTELKRLQAAMQDMHTRDLIAGALEVEFTPDAEDGEACELPPSTLRSLRLCMRMRENLFLVETPRSKHAQQLHGADDTQALQTSLQEKRDESEKIRMAELERMATAQPTSVNEKKNTEDDDEAERDDNDSIQKLEKLMQVYNDDDEDDVQKKKQPKQKDAVQEKQPKHDQPTRYKQAAFQGEFVLSALQLRFIGEVMLRSYLDRKTVASVDVKGTDTQANILSYGEFVEAFMQLQKVDGRAIVRSCVSEKRKLHEDVEGLETTVVNMKTWVDQKCEALAAVR